MKQYVRTGFFVFILMLLIAWFRIELTKSAEVDADLLPSFTFKIGETEIPTYNSWSYLEESTEELLPLAEIDIDEAIKFDINETIRLNFGATPLKYEIRVRDDKKHSIYTSFYEIKERGKCIVEIICYWEQGKGTYMAALDIHK